MTDLLDVVVLLPQEFFVKERLKDLTQMVKRSLALFIIRVVHLNSALLEHPPSKQVFLQVVLVVMRHVDWNSDAKLSIYLLTVRECVRHLSDARPLHVHWSTVE